MKYYFKIAEIGICIKEIREKELTEDTIIPFVITEEEFDGLNEKLTIVVEEVSGENLRKKISEEQDDNTTTASLGHQKYAVYYNSDSWREKEILIYLNEDCYSESVWDLNQFISIIGLHSLFLHREAMILHASYITHNDEAILFTAPSQTGKSTQARLWEKCEGAEIINEDRVLIRKYDNEWYAYGIPMCGSSDCCKNKCAKIKAIIVLNQGNDNEIEDINKAQKYRALLLGSQYHLWNKKESQLMHDLISDLVENLDIVNYICKPDRSAVDCLKKYLEGRIKNEC